MESQLPNKVVDNYKFTNYHGLLLKINCPIHLVMCVSKLIQPARTPL